MYEIGISQALSQLKALNIDIESLGREDVIRWADESDWPLMIRDIQKLDATRKHNEANPKPKAKKRTYVQKTKGRTAATIVKGMTV